MRKAVFVIVLIAAAQTTRAADLSWQVFDAAYPDDFIDKLSVTFPSKGIARFWERAGAGRLEREGKVTYPSYTLTEINCRQRTSRDIKWDYALEDLRTSEGLAARANFFKSTLQLQKKYPSAWESIEPSKHSYARLEFVCAKAPK